MKRILVIGLILITSLTGLSVVSSQNDNQPKSIKSINGCNYGQCWATAASTGQRCRHCVSNYGDSYCWQHY